MTDRDAARELLRELLPELLGEALAPTTNGNGHHPAPAANGNGNGNGHRAEPAAVPAPPTAAVLRPSTWSRPPAPGEVIGDGSPSPRSDAAGAAMPARGVEIVALDSDEDLDRFVRALLARFENPRDRMALRSGQLRFALRRPDAGAAAGGDAMRIERGAVTERTVKRAAESGARLVLAPAAVLTPLAREKARALGVEIERERRC